MRNSSAVRETRSVVRTRSEMRSAAARRRPAAAAGEPAGLAPEGAGKRRVGADDQSTRTDERAGHARALEGVAVQLGRDVVEYLCHRPTSIRSTAPPANRRSVQRNLAERDSVA